MSSSATEILDQFNRERLTEFSRETFDLIAKPLADGLKYDEIEVETGIGKRDQVKRMNRLREEMRAIQDGPSLAPLKQEDFDTLKESIRQHGQVVPILVGKDGTVVDGSNRKRACEELGLEPKIETLDVEGDAARDLGFILNMTRRHLTATQRTKIVVQELLHDPEKSDRSIALSLGVSPTTVGQARRRLEEDGKVSRMDTRRGVDGVEQPLRSSGPAPAYTLDDRVAAVNAALMFERKQRIVLISDALVDEMKDWSSLVRVRAEVQSNGLVELMFQVAGEELEYAATAEPIRPESSEAA